jgi:hypothetical protein
MAEQFHLMDVVAVTKRIDRDGHIVEAGTQGKIVWRNDDEFQVEFGEDDDPESFVISIHPDDLRVVKDSITASLDRVISTLEE